MTEPDWTELRDSLMSLTLKQFKPVRKHFLGCLGGASTKAEAVGEMVSQMRHWWRSCGEGGRARVAEVLDTIQEVKS